MPGEALELEEPLGADRIGGEELGQLVDLPGPEGDVDERKALEDLVLDRLRPAAANPDDTLGAFALQPLGVAEVGGEASVGVLPYGSRVEEDQVGIVASLGFAVAERLKHPLHPLGVMLVHLTPERREVIALHPPPRLAAAGRALRPSRLSGRTPPSVTPGSPSP